MILERSSHFLKGVEGGKHDTGAHIRKTEQSQYKAHRNTQRTKKQVQACINTYRMFKVLRRTIDPDKEPFKNLYTLYTDYVYF